MSKRKIPGQDVIAVVVCSALTMRDLPRVSTMEKIAETFVSKFYGSRLQWFCLGCLALVGGLLYANTLEVPWYFDDIHSIVENSALRDLAQTLKHLFEPRGLANLTFALNYHFGGIDPKGYHLANISIHIITTGLVFLILKRVWRDTLLWPFFGALVFLVHPLQTQSVTYIVQRITSLCGLFFFLSIYLFFHARAAFNSEGKFFAVRHASFYGLSLFCGALAVLTKQNAAVLPAALFLLEVFFSEVPVRSRWKLAIYLLPFVVAPLWLGVYELVLPAISGTSFGAVSHTQVLAGSGPVSPLYYLTTEFVVFWLYLKLLFWPVGQALDYSYTIVKTLLPLPNLLALAGLLGLGGIAVFLRKRRPLISFGIAWFFLVLSIESTFIPLDPVFEHRLYLPMFGFVIVLLDLLLSFFSRKIIVGLMILICLVLAVLTWQRNALWNNPVAFYEDNLRKAPWSERVNVALAKSYMDIGRNSDALVVLKRALEINPQYEEVYLNLSSIYVSGKEYAQAQRVLERGLQINPGSAGLLDNLGVLYDLTGEPEKAIETLTRVIRYTPDYYSSYLNLGVVYAGLGDWDNAISWYQSAIDLFYEKDQAHYNLGVAYYRLNRLADSLQEFKIAVEFDPENAEALHNYALVSFELGDIEFARRILPRLTRLDKALARDLEMEMAEARSSQ